MTGKKWFYWLGKLHGSRNLSRERLLRCYPEWVCNAYMRGWWDGWDEASK